MMIAAVLVVNREVDPDDYLAPRYLDTLANSWSFKKPASRDNCHTNLQKVLVCGPTFQLPQKWYLPDCQPIFSVRAHRRNHLEHLTEEKNHHTNICVSQQPGTRRAYKLTAE